MALTPRETPSPTSPGTLPIAGLVLRPERRTSNTTIRSMQFGLHLLTAALVVISAIRAVLSGAPLALAVGSAVVISCWYLAGVLMAGRVQRTSMAGWWLLGLALLWIGAVTASAEFLWLAFSLWLLAGYILPWRWAVAFSIVVYAMVAAAPILEFGSTTFASAIGPLLGGVFALSIARGYVELVQDLRERQALVVSLTHAQAEMTALQEELAQTQRISGALEERTRISRDIHDTIAQGLSSISLLATAAVENAQIQQMPRTLQQVDALARDNLADVRRIVAALAPAELEEGALAGALGRMLERLSAETGLRTEVRVDEGMPALPTTVEVALLRTAQSALANVRQHAEATRVVVNLADAGNSVRLDIVDDGHGFDVLAWDRAFEGLGESGAGGYGMHSMRARLRELGGGLDVESRPGEGVALSAHVPLTQGPKDGA
ncbi:two-component sensor histidine kinase [Paeniglutamicibacter gangotriensis Lz1y]|uniref:Two-component sensor histidine kinase n=2 Tax=Paeniglutamicibacter gangotriensis TaxID=254787 RepID=M7NEA5_9MICC|nr:two-component sensor histidine kinase [Paeniglutamicibacter gangotriensis Lz1y]